MPGVVSDSSPLIHLTVSGHLNLLHEFFHEVTIPPSVWREVVEEGHGRVGAHEVEEAVGSGWLKIVDPKNKMLLRLLKRDLDHGEAEAIALALEQKADLILLDESEARRIAEVYGLEKTGVIGLLIRARKEEKISSLRTELDRLRQEAGFWISDELCREILENVGEA